ncbi:MAG: hypothetical protein ABIB71_00295 [Candidatus Woesearchaeota archaeon]
MVNWRRLKKPGLYTLAFVVGYCLASGKCDGIIGIIKNELGAEGIGLIEKKPPRPSTWMCHEKYIAETGRWKLECYDMLRED